MELVSFNVCLKPWIETYYYHYYYYYIGLDYSGIYIPLEIISNQLLDPSLISIVLRCSFAPYQQVIHDYYTGIPSKKLFNETLKDNRSRDDSKWRPASSEHSWSNLICQKPLLASSVEKTVTLAMREATSSTVLVKSDLMPLVQQSFNQIASANQAAKTNNGVLWAPS